MLLIQNSQYLTFVCWEDILDVPDMCVSTGRLTLYLLGEIQHFFKFANIKMKIKKYFTFLETSPVSAPFPTVQQ